MSAARTRRYRLVALLACLPFATSAAVADTAVADPGVGPASRPGPGRAVPVVDPAYLYAQLYRMATSFSYRISGADGDPRDAADPFNLPPTVNGWQELVAFWKSALTDPRANTELARFATVTDHYFRRTGGYRFDSDDAEVTIPGAGCAGQRVMLTAHPDETPVPADVAGLIDSGSTSGVTGFGAARRHITDSNLGNEGAYDGLSGVAMTVGEYQALLSWYHANGTYPARTLKVTLLDASRGRTADGLFGREGAAHYAADLIPNGPQGQVVALANMDSLGLDYPAYHLGTEFFWNNVTGGGVPPWFTFIKAAPAGPNRAYPDTGPGSPGAALAGNAAAVGRFRTDLVAAVLAGFAQQGGKYGFSVPLENPLRYNKTGQAPNPAVPTPTKPAYSPADQALYSPVRDDTDGLEDEQPFFDRGIPGFTVSGVKNSGPDENPYAAGVSPTVKGTPVVGYAGNQTTFQLGNNTPQPGMTAVAADTAAGDRAVRVAAVTNLAAGQPVLVGTGDSIEYGHIESVGTAGPDGTGVTLAAPLTLPHPAGAPFYVNENQPVGYLSDTIEHLNYFAAGAPHGAASPAAPTEELTRALELPAQWTSLLLSGEHYLGAVRRPRGPVAYFETTPARPTATRTVTFDAGFSRDGRGAGGDASGLRYFWDFGDGTHAVGARVTHTFAGPVHADVRLAVRADGRWGTYRQVVDVAGPTGPSPAGDPCGTLGAAQASSLISAAGQAVNG
jgi:PKD domain-containing protein